MPEPFFFGVRSGRPPTHHYRADNIGNCAEQPDHRIRHFELLDELRHPEDQAGKAKNSRTIGKPEDPDFPTEKRGLEIGVPVRSDLVAFLLHHPIIGCAFFLGQPFGFLRGIGQIEQNNDRNAVPSHVIRGTFLMLITTEVWNGIGDLNGLKHLLVKDWEFFRVPRANGRKPPWPPGAGSGVDLKSLHFEGVVHA